ncbi:hypothetical protein ZWY2020_028595 [Hordeum vulgare]|nr:hypothetical protein ZWY2020_028595 [Hordeum vulgare]
MRTKMVIMMKREGVAPNQNHGQLPAQAPGRPHGYNHNGKDAPPPQVRDHDHLPKHKLVKSTISYTRKRYDRTSGGPTPHNRLDRANSNSFYSKAKIESLSQHQEAIGTLLNRNKEYQSLMILSASNCSRIGLFNTPIKLLQPFSSTSYHFPRHVIVLYPWTICFPFNALFQWPRRENFSIFHLWSHNRGRGESINMI